MKKIGIAALALGVGLVFGASPLCWARESDKEDPKVICTQGEATRSIPVDGVRLFFRFPVEKGSFDDARRSGDELVAKIRSGLGALPVEKTEIIHSWDLVRQAVLSWGTKGKRIDHNFAVELEGIPAGKLHEIVAQVVDRSLPVYDKLELERIEVYLREPTEQAARGSLYREAAKVALANAKGVAEASDVRLVGPRAFFTNSNVASLTEANVRYKSGLLSEAASSFDVRKSFKVRGDVPAELDLSVSVVGVFEIE